MHLKKNHLLINNQKKFNMTYKESGFIMLIVALIFNTSCKKDFSTIGNGLIDNPLFEGKLYDEALVKIYDQRVEKVLSVSSSEILAPNLSVTSFGIYKDNKFGTLTADIIASVSPDAVKFNKEFGQNVKLIGAQLIVPYFSHTKTENGETIYELDSIFGNQPFDIKIYEQTYLLPSYDPNHNLEIKRHYYSDFDFAPFKTTMIGDSLDFEVSNLPYITYKRDNEGNLELDDDDNPIVKDSLAPHMVIKLDTTYFRQKIFDHSGESILSNSQMFKDYFRGVYVEASSNTGEGSFIQFNFNQGKIIVQYTEEIENDNETPNDTSDDFYETFYRELKLPLGEIIINHYENALSGYTQNALNNSDLINGDSEVILKGEAGSESVITLFNDQQLRELRLKDWLINQAELYLYVDENQTDEMLAQAQRIFLFDYDNKKHLADIFAPENTSDNNYKVFNGELNTDDDGNSYYKFGITRHIRNVLSKDSTNVKLGLRVISQIPSILKIKEFFRDPDAYNPKGVILYGNQTGTEFKPVLKIRYTDPDE